MFSMGREGWMLGERLQVGQCLESGKFLLLGVSDIVLWRIRTDRKGGVL